jgi:PLP dependent protein
MSITDKLRRVRERIARAAEASGRSADAVTLVGVTKYVSAAEARQLADAGCTDLGESRPQELWAKAAALEEQLPSIASVPRWHLIGHLQRNKVRRTLPVVWLIHSVDSQRLLATIDKEWQSLRLERSDLRERVPVLLEVNTSGECAKHGLEPSQVEAAVTAMTGYPHVALCGLMTMAALEGGADVAARNFAALRELRDALRRHAPACVRLDELSMGMSGDFEVAIREGATIVRVGSALWE